MIWRLLAQILCTQTVSCQEALEGLSPLLSFYEISLTSWGQDSYQWVMQLCGNSVQ